MVSITQTIAVISIFAKYGLVVAQNLRFAGRSKTLGGSAVTVEEIFSLRAELMDLVKEQFVTLDGLIEITVAMGIPQKMIKDIFGVSGTLKLGGLTAQI